MPSDDPRATRSGLAKLLDTSAIPEGMRWLAWTAAGFFWLVGGFFLVVFIVSTVQGLLDRTFLSANAERGWGNFYASFMMVVGFPLAFGVVILHLINEHWRRQNADFSDFSRLVSERGWTVSWPSDWWRQTITSLVKRRTAASDPDLLQSVVVPVEAGAGRVGEAIVVDVTFSLHNNPATGNREHYTLAGVRGLTGADELELLTNDAAVQRWFIGHHDVDPTALFAGLKALDPMYEVVLSWAVGPDCVLVRSNTKLTAQSKVHMLSDMLVLAQTLVNAPRL